MAVPNEIKAQTIRNLWHLRVASPIVDAYRAVAAIRQAITGQGLADEFTAPELAAMQAVETAVYSLADLPGVTAAASKHVPSHRAQAITIEGVND